MKQWGKKIKEKFKKHNILKLLKYYMINLKNGDDFKMSLMKRMAKLIEQDMKKVANGQSVTVEEYVNSMDLSEIEKNITEARENGNTEDVWVYSIGDGNHEDGDLIVLCEEFGINYNKNDINPSDLWKKVNDFCTRMMGVLKDKMNSGEKKYTGEFYWETNDGSPFSPGNVVLTIGYTE